MRNEEGETVLAIPPVAGLVVVRIELPAIVIATQTEQVRIAIRVGHLYKTPPMPPPLEVFKRSRG